MTASSSRSEPVWYPRDHEAIELAASLRTARLTLLIGAAGAGKTSLLNAGVMPLLRRRAGDLGASRRGSSVVVPFPDRRAGASGGRESEVVVLFDDWRPSPLAALMTRLQGAIGFRDAPRATPGQSLADRLEALTRSGNTRVLVLLDRFDEWLALPRERDDVQVFAEQFIEAASRPGLRAHFLLSFRDGAHPALVPLRERIGGFDEHSVFLLSPAAPPVGATAKAAAGRRADPARQALEATPEPETPADAMSLSALYASIEDRLTRTATVNQQPAWGDGGHEAGVAPPANPVPAAPREHDALRAQLRALIDANLALAAPPEPDAALPLFATPKTPAAATAAADAAGPMSLSHLFGQHSAQNDSRLPTDAVEVADPDPLAVDPDAIETQHYAVAEGVAPARAAERPWLRRAGKLVMPLVFVGVVAMLAVLLWPSDDAGMATAPASDAKTVADAPPAPVAAATPLPPPLPRIDLLTDAEDGTDARIAVEMARRIGAAAGFDLEPRPALHVLDAPPPASSTSAPQLAIAGYDALQSAHDALGNTPPASSSGTPRLEIVSPLYLDEVYFVVRRDSPLQSIHQIRGQRINVGPAQGRRGRAAAAIYERMFGTQPPTSSAVALDREAALPLLLDGSGLDVMMLIGAQPSSWLAGLPPQAADQLRLLALDDKNPASRKLLQRYLPAKLQSGGGLAGGATVPTVAVMSFLVAWSDSSPAAQDALHRVAQSLCKNLPALQRDGQKKWREVQAGLQLPVAWPYAPSAQRGFAECDDAAAASDAQR